MLSKMPEFNLIAYRLSGGRTSICRSFTAQQMKSQASETVSQKGFLNCRQT